MDLTTILTNWPATPADAVTVQNELRHQVRLTNDFTKLEIVAGVDCSYDVTNNLSYAYVTTMRLDRLQPLETVTAQLPITFPYIPGFLSFREVPVVLHALAQLSALPDLLMVDGQGVAHPRRFGIACHLGVLTNLLAIGVAKSRLIGTAKPLGDSKGSQQPLMDKQERIGTVLRSKDNTNPLFISPGHKLDQDAAVAITFQCLTRYRLPEPTRVADKISKQPRETSNLLI